MCGRTCKHSKNGEKRRKSKKSMHFKSINSFDTTHNTKPINISYKRFLFFHHQHHQCHFYHQFCFYVFFSFSILSVIVLFVGCCHIIQNTRARTRIQEKRTKNDDNSILFAFCKQKFQKNATKTHTHKTTQQHQPKFYENLPIRRLQTNEFIEKDREKRENDCQVIRKVNKYINLSNGNGANRK